MHTVRLYTFNDIKELLFTDEPLVGSGYNNTLPSKAENFLEDHILMHPSFTMFLEEHHNLNVHRPRNIKYINFLKFPKKNFPLKIFR